MVPNGFKFCPHEGYIPLDWEVKNAEEVCTKVTDGTHDTPKATSTGVPYITAIHVKDGKIDFSNSLFLPEDVHSDIYRRCNPQRGDLLVVNIGAGVAECGFVDVDYEFSLKNVALLKPNTNFLYPKYLLHHHLFKQERVAHKVKSGGAQPFLSLKELRKLKLVIPPLPEQQKIAKILSTWDKAIATTEMLIATSQQQKKALMQQLLTGNKRLVNPDTGKVFEGEWTYSLFNELYKVANKKDTQVKSGDYLESGRTPIVDQGKSMIGGYTNNELIYKDLPVIVFGDHTRVVKWVDFEFAQGADGTQVFKSNKLMDDKFAYYVLLNTDIPNLGYSRHMKELKERDFKYPKSKAEQQKIASALTAADKEIELLQAKLDHLKDEKKALMQQLLTGKRRVKVN